MKQKCKYFFFFLLGCIVSGGIVYAAYSIDSTAVSYSPNGNDSQIKSVQDALDELYSKANDRSLVSGALYLGTGTTFNIKNLYPNHYQKFTNDNFIVGAQSTARVNATGYTNPHRYISGYISPFNLQKSYNPSTGILTITGTQYGLVICNDDSYLYCNDGSGYSNVVPFAFLVSNE